MIPNRKLVIAHGVNTSAGHKVSRADFGKLVTMILDPKLHP